MMSSAAFYRRAVELGVQFRFGERVTDIVRRRGGVVGVRTDKGGYATETVVNAAGAWARPIAQSAGLDTPVVPDSHEAGITEPVARFFTPMLVDIRPHRRRAQLLLLPAQAGRHRLLHHARPADRRHRPARDVGLPADDRQPDGWPDAEAGQHQGAADLARPLPDDARRRARGGLVEEGRRLRARGGHVRPGLHARARRRRGAEPHGARRRFAGRSGRSSRNSDRTGSSEGRRR